MRLVQLPWGTWIDATRVTVIRAAGPYVHIEGRDGPIEKQICLMRDQDRPSEDDMKRMDARELDTLISCSSSMAAREMADRVAAIIDQDHAPYRSEQ